AGDVDVWPAVVVEVGGRGAHAVGATRLPVAGHEHHGRRPARAGDAGSFGDVDESAVAAIAIERVRAAGVAERAAGDGDVVVAAVGGIAGARRFVGVEVHVAGNEEIEVAVAVVVEEITAGVPR